MTDAIEWAEDGPILTLEDGTRVRPTLTDEHTGETMPFKGGTRFGGHNCTGENQPSVTLGFERVEPELAADGAGGTQANLSAYEVTLRVEARTDVSLLRRLFTSDHAYGPVQRLRAEREDHTSSVGFGEGESIGVVDVTPVEDDDTDLATDGGRTQAHTIDGGEPEDSIVRYDGFVTPYGGDDE